MALDMPEPIVCLRGIDKTYGSGVRAFKRSLMTASLPVAVIQ